MSFSEVVENILTIQGEAYGIGRLCYLIRFKKCNKNCPMCDSKDKMQYHGYPLDFETILNHILKFDSELILLTGGEPLLYAQEINHFFQFLEDTKVFNFKQNLEIVIETNGTLFNKKTFSTLKLGINYIQQKTNLNWSPKIFDKEDIDANLSYMQSYFKYGMDFDITIKPIVDKNNKEYIQEFVDILIRWWSKAKTKIYLMPIGKTNEELQENFPVAFELAKKLGVRISPRLQIQYNCL